MRQRVDQQRIELYNSQSIESELERIIDQVENDVALQSLPKHEGYPEFLQPIPPKRTREEWLALGGQGAEMAFDPVPIFRNLSTQILFGICRDRPAMVSRPKGSRPKLPGLLNRR